MKTYYNFLFSFFFLIPLFSQAQNRDEIGYISFPKCEKLEEDELKSCNIYELKNFISYQVEYPKIASDNGYEGEVLVKYILTARGEIKTSLQKNSKTHSSLDKAAMQVIGKLKDSIALGKIKVVPAQLNGKYISSFYRLPIRFELPDKDPKQPIISSEKKMIIATYRTSEKTIQFRRDLKGNIYSYSLTPKGEKLEIRIDGNTDLALLSEEQQSFFFLYNLTFLKPEVLLTFGEIKGRKYEIFIDKNFRKKENNNSLEDSETRINVYSPENSNNPIEIFTTIDELFNSKYAILLFK